MIIGHHRSLYLAEQRARREGLEIISRRRSDGSFSVRGHTFVFEERRLRQFLVIAKYNNAKGKERARIDFLVNDYSESEALTSTKIFLETVLAKRKNWEWVLGVPWEYVLEREYETIENPDAHPRRKSVEVN